MENRDVSVVLAERALEHGTQALRDGCRVVGLRVHARNARVVTRAGAQQVPLAALAQLAPERPLLALRPDLLIELAIFTQLPELQSGGAYLVGPDAGPYALWGRVGELAPL